MLNTLWYLASKFLKRVLHSAIFMSLSFKSSSYYNATFFRTSLFDCSASIFDKVPWSFTWLAYWRHGVTCYCTWSTMTLQVVSFLRPSSRKQRGTENNRSWMSTCSQVIRPWLLKVEHGKPCHTFAKLDVKRFYKYALLAIRSFD